MGFWTVVGILWLSGAVAFARGIVLSGKGKVEWYVSLPAALLWPLVAVRKPRKAITILSGRLVELEKIESE